MSRSIGSSKKKMEEFDDIDEDDDDDDDEMSPSQKGSPSSSPTFRRTAMEVIRKQEHAHFRMEDGLKKLLQLHTANELSSISGQLGLKILQKASVSIDQIMMFMESGNKEKIITLEIAEKLLYCMWETPMLEYLRSTGHPVHPLSQLDPRKTLLSIWLEGGFISSVNSTDFVPHFIVREVKKRYLLSTLSKDIVTTLEKIRLQQEKVKRSEQTIMTERDYRHILKYFKDLGELRSMENKLRDVLVSELDIARAEKDSAEETLAMATSQLGEVELQFVRVAENLNAQLAECECLCENMLRERLKAESELQRLSLVVDSYIDTERNRSMPRGGDLQPLCMYQVSEECNQEIYHLHEKLRRYRDVRDDRDDVLREKVRAQSDEIERLNATIQRLEGEKEEMARVAGEEQTFAANKFAALLEYAEVLVASESKNKVLAREGYASALRHASVASELQRKQNQAIAALKSEMLRMIDVAVKNAALVDSVPSMSIEEAMMQQQQPPKPETTIPSKSPPKSRPTSPQPKKSRPTTPAKERPTSPSSPGKKRPTKVPEPEPVAAPVPVPVIATSRPPPCILPAESMAFCYYLAASFGVADDKDMVSMREMDERLTMGDEDRQMLVLVAKQRLEAAIALAAHEAAEAAAAALKAAKAKTNKPTANKAGGRAVSPTPVIPAGKGTEKKKGGSATAEAKKGGKAGKSPSPARGRTASPAKGNGAKQGKASPSPAAAAAKGRASSPEKGGAKPNTSPGKGKSVPTKDKARSVSPGKKGK